MRVITPGEMAEIDRAAIEGEKIPGLELMERAGERAAEAARDMVSQAGERRVAVWCGKGNNGGDGFVVARMLGVSGFDVTVFLLASPSEVRGDALANLERLSSLQVSLVEVKGPKGIREFSRSVPPFDLVVDAIFGTGFSGSAEGVFADAIHAINEAGCQVLSIDIPSGVSGDTGAVPGPAVRASRTVTFMAPKVGLVQFPGAELAGGLEVVDIGIPEHLMERIPTSRVFLTTEDEALSLLPARPWDAHKRQCGSVLVVGGSPGMTGAAVMCARAALRSGAGLVTLAVPEGLHGIVEIKMTEVMTRPLPQGPAGALSLRAAGTIAEISKRFDVLVLGPGLSTADDAPHVVRELIKGTDVPVVLDADGLNSMAGHTGLLQERTAPLVLTPHPGEMARLLQSSNAEVQADRIKAAHDAAAKWGAVVVLKGARTVVAGPEGDVRINMTGNPGMATAGMGDVLTGLIAALMAQGLRAFDAGVAGAYFHGHAADMAANMDGMVGMVAGDVIRHLPLALRKRELD